MFRHWGKAALGQLRTAPPPPRSQRISRADDAVQAIAARTHARWLWLVTAVIVGVAAFVADTVFVARFGVNVPVQDDWDAIAPYVVADKEDRLHISDMFNQHSEHRMFFPKLVLVLLARATHYNSVAAMYFIALMLFVTFLIVASVSTATWKRRAPLLLAAFAALIFTLRQYLSILFAIQVAWGMATLFGVTSLFLLSIPARTRYRAALTLCAAACAIVSSYSVLYGLLVWIAGVIPLLILRKRLWLTLIWLGAGGTTWWLYFRNWTRPYEKPSATFVFHHPVEFAAYFVRLAGSTLSSSSARALLIGLVWVALSLAALVGFAWRRHLADRMAFWLGLLAFGALSMLLVTAGRVSTFSEATTSRYVLISMPALLGTLGMAWILADDLGAPVRIGVQLLGAAVVLGTVNWDVHAFRDVGPGHKFSRDYMAFVVLTLPTQPDEEIVRSALYPRAKQPIRDIAAALRRHRLSVFRDRPDVLPPSLGDLEPAAEPPQCASLAVNDVPVTAGNVEIPASNTIRISGACRADGGRGIDGVYIGLNGHEFPAFLIDAKLGGASVGSGGWVPFYRALPLGALGTTAGVVLQGSKLRVTTVSSDRGSYTRTPAIRLRFRL